MSAQSSTVRHAINAIVESMEIDELEDLLGYLEDRELYSPESLERIRKAEEEIARGQVVTQEEFEAKYPL